jgi:hypothetical protein
MFTQKTILAVVLAVVGTVAAPSQAHEGGHPAPRGGDSAGLRFRLVAPSAGGIWGLRIDNTSQRAVRLAADVRLLRLAITAPRNEKQALRRSRVTVCDGPRDFGLRRRFPAGRALVLEPGFSYAERFDPRLLCFGAKASKLVAGATVNATFGYKPKSKWQRRPARPPFVAEFSIDGVVSSSLRQLIAPTITLSAGVSPGHGKAELDGFPASRPGLVPPVFVSEVKPQPDKRKAQASPAGMATAPTVKPGTTKTAPPRLTLTTSRHADAAKKRNVRLSVQAHNSGPRPLLVALRARQLSFLVAGPERTQRCGRPGRHHVPRDLLRRLREGKHIHVDVLLGEICPSVSFARPGLYRASPTMYAIEADDDSAPKLVRQRVTVHDAGKVGGTHVADDDATLIRIRIGSRSLYTAPPSGIATASLPD